MKHLASALLAAVGAALWIAVAHAQPAYTPDSLVWEKAILDVVVDGDAERLQALIARPPGPGPFPMVVLAHGASPAAERRGYSLMTYSAQQEEFARRGYAAVYVLRRGYGKSTGESAEWLGNCQPADYIATGHAAAKDLVAAIDTLRARPDLDTKHVLVVGQSAGGLAALALASSPPPGVVGVINFAGGLRPANSDRCDQTKLADAVGQLGRTSRLPMLWVYAGNDSYFSPTLVELMQQAWTKSGAPLQFVQVAKYGNDGHALFSRGGIPVWRPIIDEFLNKVGLLNWTTPPDDPPFPMFDPPEDLKTARAKEDWANYLRAPRYKAFAVDSVGGYGWRTARESRQEAVEAALRNCQASGRECSVLAVDDALIP
jgi:dienelactone hydrolase